MKDKNSAALIFCLGILLLANSAGAAYLPTDKYDYHYVSPGETLRSIAKSYYGDERDFWPIAKLNNLANPDRIIAGTILKVELHPGQAVATAPVKIETPPSAPEQPQPATPVRWHGWRIGGLYGGGGGFLQAGTDFNAGPIVLNVSGGIGLGKNYSMANLQLSKEFDLPGDCRLGLSGVYANYSKFIADVPWTDSVLNKGDNYSLGAYISKDVNEWELKAGYSTVLGPTVGISRYF